MIENAPLDNIRIVLCGTRHPGNIGAAARAMKTMGLTKLHLVRPERFPDAEAQWRAARAIDLLQKAQVHDSLDDALRGVALAVACSARPREMAVAVVDAREAAARVIAIAQAQTAAVVFGNETYGLTTAEVNTCQLLASIPANPDYASLNLAAAVQVLAYELRMSVIGAPPAPQPALAAHEDLESLYAYLESRMAEVGFLDPDQPRKLMPRLRRLLARSQLEPEEVNILRGLFKALSRRSN